MSPNLNGRRRLKDVQLDTPASDFVTNWSAARADFDVRKVLGEYHLAYAARADFCRRLGRTVEARSSYERALALADQGPERRFLEARLKGLSA